MGLASFVQEIGEVLERNLKSKAVIVTIMVLAALFHVVCFIILGILSFTLYIRSLRGPLPLFPKRDDKETGTIVIGIVLFGFGLYYLVRSYIPEFGWQIAFVLVGSFLIAFGLSRGSERREAGH